MNTPRLSKTKRRKRNSLARRVERALVPRGPILPPELMDKVLHNVFRDALYPRLLTRVKM